VSALHHVASFSTVCPHHVAPFLSVCRLLRLCTQSSSSFPPSVPVLAVRVMAARTRSMLTWHARTHTHIHIYIYIYIYIYVRVCMYFFNVVSAYLFIYLSLSTYPFIYISILPPFLAASPPSPPPDPSPLLLHRLERDHGWPSPSRTFRNARRGLRHPRDQDTSAQETAHFLGLYGAAFVFVSGCLLWVTCLPALGL
jgi:hypothetical protein